MKAKPSKQILFYLKKKKKKKKKGKQMKFRGVRWRWNEYLRIRNLEKLIR